MVTGGRDRGARPADTLGEVSQYPPAVPADTTPETWRVQMRAMAALAPQQRLALWADMNEKLAVSERAALRRRHPVRDETEFRLLVLQHRFGAEIAEQCRPLLNRLAIDAHPSAPSEL